MSAASSCSPRQKSRERIDGAAKPRACRHGWRAFGALIGLALAGAPAGAATDGTAKWSFSLQGFVLSSPAIGPDGTIYVGAEGVGRRLWALNPNGTFKWAFPNTLVPVNDWFDAAPAIGDDGTIYLGNLDGRLFAINPNGTEKWSVFVGGFVLSSVAIGPDGTLYVGAGDGALHAFDPVTGVEKWDYFTGDWVDSSPAVGGDGTIYFGSWDGSLYALHPNGTLKWSVPTGDAVQSSPAIGADGTIYIGSSDGKLYAVRADGSVAWTFATDDSVDASPVVGPDGTIYFGSADGRFYAVQPDGTAAWAQPFDVGFGIFGAAAIRADGAIIFGSTDRKLHALNADGTLKWSYATGDLVDSSPTIGADGTIYVGSYDAKLHAINGNGAGLMDAPWPKFRRDVRNQGRVTGAALPTAPDITVAPASQTVEYGATVTFAVEATGTQPFSFQWQKNGADIAGATNASYVIAQATAGDAGMYRVRITNAAGFDVSAGAVLAINPPVAPTIVREPRPLALVPGHRLSLWTVASGSPPLAYQWFRNGSPLAAATTQFYEVDAATAGDAGAYTVQVTNAGGSATSTAATVTVEAAMASQLVNLSSRAVVGTNDSILIPGFVITGTAPRRLLIRAVGPTLGADPYAVSGVLANPTLTIYTGQSAVFTNDDWGAAPNAAEILALSDTLGAFPLLDGGADAVALVDVAPGLYTVQVSGVSATTGVALVELYDAGAVGAGESRLVNISSRADSGAGDDVSILGISIAGAAAKTLLIRAVGPTLSNPPYNVQGVLADPVLRLFEGPNEILTVNDWTAAPDPAALADATGAVQAFALDGGSADAAVLVVLMPGSYTAQASGFGGTTGNVLVEVYEVQ